uniref:Transmembrane protein 65 n=1 Tax=Eptatretus burgeri TaxID=7764 RepID=A0A8C4WYF1_EPTBU
MASLLRLVPSIRTSACLGPKRFGTTGLGVGVSYGVPVRLVGTPSMESATGGLASGEGARDFIYGLQGSERKVLLRELREFESLAAEEEQMQVDTPTTTQLRHVFIHNAVPFVGFGLLDNCIMITAGTKIELSFGVILSISTMAAAALGNLVSDLAGLGLAGYVEILSGKVGFPAPHLTPKQTDMWQTRVTSHLGGGLGITVGCILGMFPLLFLSEHEDDRNSPEKQN